MNTNEGAKMQAFKVFNQGNEQYIRTTIAFTTEAEQVAFIAKFPKYVKVLASTITGMDHGFSNAPSNTMPTASFTVNLIPNQATGEVNETGLKRVAKFREIVTISEIVETNVEAAR